MVDQLQIQWTADSILDVLRRQREALQAMGVRRIGLFGSYVRGEQQPESDMDFLFTIDNFNFSSWMEVWNFLEDTFGVSVDLVLEQDLRPELRPYVLSEVRYVEEL